ncbi:hypothetical protein [Acinetobacter guillouiae]|uniref:hypothetical protein n=1 Tax=Acinetobacter guillouiae TaxID=106649 RepID=UPI0012503A93|nr:hypothetical protein [Acinetobacter guillouiae]
MEKNEYREEKNSKYIYSSKRRIQRRVLQLEKTTAEAIHHYIQFSYQDRWFESNFAFLSCWKFSKVDFGKSDTFWCDAIYFKDFHIENNKIFVFSGHAWISLLSNVGSEWKVPVKGRFYINSKGKILKNYTLIFYNGSQELILSKK